MFNLLTEAITTITTKKSYLFAVTSGDICGK